MGLGRCLMCMPVKWDTCWYIVHWTGLCKKNIQMSCPRMTPSRSWSSPRKGKRRQQGELDFGYRYYIFLFKTVFVVVVVVVFSKDKHVAC